MGVGGTGGRDREVLTRPPPTPSDETRSGRYIRSGLDLRPVVEDREEGLVGGPFVVRGVYGPRVERGCVEDVLFVSPR